MESEEKQQEAREAKREEGIVAGKSAMKKLFVEEAESDK